MILSLFLSLLCTSILASCTTIQPPPYIITNKQEKDIDIALVLMEYLTARELFHKDGGPDRFEDLAGLDHSYGPWIFSAEKIGVQNYRDYGLRKDVEAQFIIKEPIEFAGTGISVEVEYRHESEPGDETISSVFFSRPAVIHHRPASIKVEIQ